MGWLSNLFKPKEYKVEQTTAPDDTIRGLFKYKCIISCANLDAPVWTEVTVNDDKTTPIYKCPCGTKIELLPAPIVDSFEFGGRKVTTVRGKSSIKDCVGGHSVRLGETLHYEITRNRLGA